MYYSLNGCIARTLYERKHGLVLTLKKTSMIYAEELINSIRPFNKIDPGFIYTCGFNRETEETCWIFVYQQRKIRDIAGMTIKQYLNYLKRHHSELDPHSKRVNFSNYDDFECPLR